METKKEFGSAVEVLMKKWTFVERIICFGFGSIVTCVFIGNGLTKSSWNWLGVPIGLVCLSLAMIRSRVMFDPEAQALWLDFRWLCYRRLQVIPVVDISELSMERFGKGGLDVRLHLKNGTDISLTANPAPGFVERLESRLHLTCVEIPPASVEPFTKWDAFQMLLLIHGISIGFGIELWNQLRRSGSSPGIYLGGAVVIGLPILAWWQCRRSPPASINSGAPMTPEELSSSRLTQSRKDRQSSGFQLLLGNLLLVAFATPFSIVGWLAATRKADDGRMHPGLSCVLVAFATAALLAALQMNIHWIQRRRRPIV